MWIQPTTLTEANELVIVLVLQPSVAVARPGAGTELGLQPKFRPDGQKVNVGTAVSAIQVNTCVHVAVFPHASVAVYVRVWVREQPLVLTVPNELVIVLAPQPSVAVAAPGAGTALGLQPKS